MNISAVTELFCSGSPWWHPHRRSPLADHGVEDSSEEPFRYTADELKPEDIPEAAPLMATILKTLATMVDFRTSQSYICSDSPLVSVYS